MAFNKNDYIYRIPIMEFYREDTINLFFRFWYTPNLYGEVLPIDLSLGVRPVWYLCPYRQYNNPVLIKNMIISAREKNLCSVALTSEDTRDLDYIKFSHQPILIMQDNPNMKYIRAEGDIILHPNIKQDIF